MDNSHTATPEYPISACLVTRGDLPMDAIRAELAAAGIAEVIVWDNSRQRDEGVYGRYRAVEQAAYPLCYTQDDDCFVPAATILALIEAHQPGTITANMPERFWPHYPDSCLLGFGAVFEREMPEQAFARYAAYRRRRLQAEDRKRRPDVVFTALTPHTKLALPVENLPVATAEYRLYRQPGHSKERERVLRQARRARMFA